MAKQKAGAQASPAKETGALANVLRWGLLGWLVVLPFLVPTRGMAENGWSLLNGALLPKAIWAETIALLLLLAWAVLVWRGRLRLRLAASVGALLVFAAWSFASLAWAVNTFEALRAALRWGAGALAAWLVLQVITSDVWRRRALVALAMAGAGVAFIGWAQYVAPASVTVFPQSGPPGATFGNRNLAAEFVLAVFPAAAALAWTGRTGPGRWGGWTASGIMVLYLIQTFSRAAWGALAVEVAVLAALPLLAARRRAAQLPERAAAGRPVIAVTVLAMLVAVLAHIGPDGWSWRSGAILQRLAGTLVSGKDTAGNDSSPGKKTTLSAEAMPAPDAAAASDSLPLVGAGASLSIRSGGRMPQWRNSLALAADHWLVGTGAGNFRVIYPAYQARLVPDPMTAKYLRWEHVHNDPLQVWIELGLVGLGVLGFAGVVALRNAWRAIAEGTADERNAAAAGAAGLAGLAAVSGFGFPLQHAAPCVVGGLWIGLLASGASVSGGGRTPPGRLGRPPAACLAIGALVASGFLIPWQVRRLQADRRAVRLDELLHTRDYAQISNAGRAVADALPMRTRPLVAAAAAELKQEHSAEAIALARAALNDYPHADIAIGTLAGGLAQEGQYAKAAEAYERLTRMHPERPGAWYGLARARLMQGRLDEALAATGHAAELMEPPDRALLLQGSIAYRLGRYEEAAASCRRVLARDPTNAEAHQGLGVALLLHLDREEEGLRHLRRAIQLAPRHPRVARLRALLQRHGAR